MITLAEILIITNTRLATTKPNTNLVLACASIPGLEIEIVGVLNSVVAFGDTRSQALRNLCDTLESATIVSRAYTTKRQTYFMPPKIQVGIIPEKYRL